MDLDYPRFTYGQYYMLRAHVLENDQTFLFIHVFIFDKRTEHVVHYLALKQIKINICYPNVNIIKFHEEIKMFKILIYIKYC